MIRALFLLIAMTAPAHSLDSLGEQFAHISSTAEGKVGACAMLLETGESASFHGGQRFPMQSVYKFPIGMAVLHEVDRGTLRLDQTVAVAKLDLAPAGLHSPIRDQHPGGITLSLRELLRFMVAESDGTASDVLLRLAGGPERVTSYLRGLAVSGVTVATSERDMARGALVQYRNWATPDQMVALLRAFQTGAGLAAPSRDLLLQFMTETGTGPHRLKGRLPPGSIVAHKTGTSGTSNGLTRATNDAGIITLLDGRHLAVAVFVSDSKATEAVREGVIAEIARAAWDHWAAASH